MLNRMFAVGIVAVLSFLQPLVLSASATTMNPANETVEIGPEFEEYLSSLPEVDRLRIENTLLLDHEEVHLEPQIPLDLVAFRSQIAATFGGDVVSPLAKVCWSSRTNRSGKAKAGNTFIRTTTLAVGARRVLSSLLRASPMQVEKRRPRDGGMRALQRGEPALSQIKEGLIANTALF